MVILYINYLPENNIFILSGFYNEIITDVFDDAGLGFAQLGYRAEP
jgi:hypothetical protein